MSTMAVASNALRSTLNPNAPLFIPAAYQQVEDFSPEWWELVKTTSWFRDHWFRQHQEQETFDGEDDDVDVTNLLPDSFDLGINDEFSNLDEATFHQVFDVVEQEPFYAGSKKESVKAGESDADALIRSLSLKSPRSGAAKPVLEPLKHHEKPMQYVSPKFSPRRIIQQPR
ncbi:uncharacterized protein A4U43_C07F15640 [Asparagus officinalis]|uniref:Uncharacterized protein n=1 Tax=Asparagus officinalis TaxID=4686 RepID=A0A5P1EC75_ASPOF|nr:protein EARLY RESPONSIVE TO DEHYDRATION 15 [Asparagus officinalis]ONK63485.1 uncharacterized protein A4U43_C07F15640 [Asparagus officinalis]